MLGSISKVRPCGHHHYYKYAHVKNYQDAYRVEPSKGYNYHSDEYDGVLDFSFHNVTTSWGTENKGFFDNRYIKKYVISAPSITNCIYMFHPGEYISANIIWQMGFPEQEIILKDFNWDKISNVSGFFYASNLKEIPKSFTPKLIPSTTFNLFRGCYSLFKLREDGNRYLDYNEYIDKAEGLLAAFYNACNVYGNLKFYFDTRYKFENVKNINSWCYNIWPFGSSGLQDFTGFSLKNLETADRAFHGCCGLKTFSTIDNMTKLTNANDMFAGCYNLTSLYPDKTSFSLPSLTSANRMFGTNYNGEGYGVGSKLDKPSTLKLCNALPTHTDGAEHLITIGIHIDHKYDPEVNLALKRVCKSYTTPIEEYGSSLGTTVTGDKGWTLTIQWNGTATENAYPAP